MNSSLLSVCRLPHANTKLKLLSCYLTPISDFQTHRAPQKRTTARHSFDFISAFAVITISK
jgi:hypothetical protein